MHIISIFLNILINFLSWCYTRFGAYPNYIQIKIKEKVKKEEKEEERRKEQHR
jgi:hypothetical protein